MKVLIKTLGCKANRYESDKLIDRFSHQFDIGHAKMKEIEKPDVLIINTCTVTHVADRKSRQAIASLKAAHPKAKVIAFGCGVNVDQKDYANLDHVDFAIKEREKVEEKLLELAKEYPTSVYSQQIPKMRTRALVKIQDGCDQFCTYCIIPKSRGRQSGKSSQKVINEVNELVEKGFKEVVLTGINIGTWMEDDRDLGWLINEILEKTTIERLRMSSIEPTDFSNQFYELFQHPRMCSHLHLCAQSGSDSILKAMRRRYMTADFKRIIEKLREVVPNIGITTDIIVGFPGETEELHKETLAFAREIGFSKIHVFPYSKREGTYAAVMKNQVDEETKKRRCAELTAIGEQSQQEFFKKHIGKVIPVLFEQQDSKGQFDGYTENYIRVRTHKAINEDFTNTIATTKLTKISCGEMIGELI